LVLFLHDRTLTDGVQLGAHLDSVQAGPGINDDGMSVHPGFTRLAY